MKNDQREIIYDVIVKLQKISKTTDTAVIISFCEELLSRPNNFSITNVNRFNIPEKIYQAVIGDKSLPSIEDEIFQIFWDFNKLTWSYDYILKEN